MYYMDNNLELKNIFKSYLKKLTITNVNLGVHNKTKIFAVWEKSHTYLNRL
jgi:hypothetical protein